MTIITLHTHIKAPIEKVFDLSRDIDFHKRSASHTNEQAIAGITSGLIKLGETVRWRGKHFGLWLTHESKITAFSRPSTFTDEMIQGHFESFKHEHHFTQVKDGTSMTDILSYEIPYGILGIFFDKTLLKKHLTEFLKKRNNALKNALEPKNHTL